MERLKFFSWHGRGSCKENMSVSLACLLQPCTFAFMQVSKGGMLTGAQGLQKELRTPLGLLPGRAVQRECGDPQGP